MPELIKDAWTGWQDYKGAGKFAVLLFALYMCIFIIKNIYSTGKSHTVSGNAFITDISDRCVGRIRVLYIYTGIMAVACIFPATAAVFMMYQTRFYNYEWIWGYVPLTCVLASGGCSIFMLLWNNTYKTAERIRASAVTAMLIFVLIVSGSVNVLDTAQTENSAVQEYDRAAALIEDIGAVTDDAICMWAPKEIMAHAREYSADIQLIYGRNMWDNALNAYLYDTYTKECEDMYQWMELLELCGEISTIYGDEGVDYDSCVTNALEAGVNVIVLPENTTEETLLKTEETAGTESVVIDGYYVIIIKRVR